MRRAPRALPTAIPAMAPGVRLGELEEPAGPLLALLFAPLPLPPLLLPLPVAGDVVWPGNCKVGAAGGDVVLDK